MTIDILTIFPEMFESVLNTSILGRARANGLITVEATDIRPFSASKHKNTDDYPYGGGAGMLMMAQPIADAIRFICEKRGVPCRDNTVQPSDDDKKSADNSPGISCIGCPADHDACIQNEEILHTENAETEKQTAFSDELDDRTDSDFEEETAALHTFVGERRVKRIYLSPRGVTLTQQLAQELAKEDELILLCGHYEGVDQRVLDKYIDMEVSIGDYVLTGGELGAMVLVDCVSRLIPGVLGSEESPQDESFSDAGLLEYPQYTRPRVFEGMEVPEVLLNGDHKKINVWRRKESILVTQQRRPELLKKANLTEKEREEFGLSF